MEMSDERRRSDQEKIPSGLDSNVSEERGQPLFDAVEERSQLARIDGLGPNPSSR
jgi:hypothetical protein